MDKIIFYGTRGTNSLTQAKYSEFGGATTCILLNLEQYHIMVDCGSGISNALEDLKDIDELHLFISHSHMDHIVGIPTLLSAFAGKKLHIWGKSFNGVSIRDSIEQIMDGNLWPVDLEIYRGIDFHAIDDSKVALGGITITNMDSYHPDGCSLFRFDTPVDSIVTCFDFCHLNGFEEKLIHFAWGAKTLIYDGTFSEEELSVHPNYGHSTPEAGARIGQKLSCEKVFITHFGEYDDDALNEWEADIQKNYPFVTFARSVQSKNRLKELLAIGTLFVTEKDCDTLIEKVVNKMMDLTGADGGTVYLLQDDNLIFRTLFNRSMGVSFVETDTNYDIPPVNINGKNICAAAAREKKLINIENCYSENGYDLSGTYAYDQESGYHTQSVIVIPMIDQYDDVIGIVQLINASDSEGNIVPFSRQDEEMLMTISCQTGMAINNSAYSQQIDDLLFGIVKIMSVGIDARSPYNANHTRNMVNLADHFLDYQEQRDGNYRVDARGKREILMSVWLHDIGKLLTPLNVLDKSSRLGERFTEVETRFERRYLLLRLALAEGTIDKDLYSSLEAERASQFELIKQINNVSYLSDSLKDMLDLLYYRTYTELDGSEQPVITDEEYRCLSIVKGTLTAEERNIVQGHVSMTQTFLSQLDFPKYYDNIPAYAGNHHEFLDGSGYPNHLTEKDLPWPCRLITICDIFEALTASDRPYKKSMPVEKALSILYEMAEKGQLDADIIREFESSKAWLDQ